MQDLPHSIWINGFPFLLLESDKFTLRYRNNGNIASLLNINTLHAKIKLAVGDLDGLYVGLQAAADTDGLAPGFLHLDTFVDVLDKYDMKVCSFQRNKT